MSGHSLHQQLKRLKIGGPSFVSVLDSMAKIGKLFLKGQMVNIFISAGYVDSVTTSQP